MRFRDSGDIDVLPEEDGFPVRPGKRAREAFCFNLDAELELTDASYATPRRTARLIARRIPALQAMLCPGDVPVLVREVPAPPAAAPAALARGLRGRAWCPTSSALGALRAAGAEPQPAPTMDTLRRVNHRGFALSVEAALDGGFGGEIVTCLDGLAQAVARPCKGHGFRLKPALSFAGRGQLRLSRDPAPAALDACSPLLRAGCLVEPEVVREADFSLHGYVSEAGQGRIGRPVRQHCDGAGVYRGSELAPNDALTAEESIALHAAGERVAQALADADYHGPFGIDGFRYRDRCGTRRFRPLVELNARYTMAWAQGYYSQSYAPR